MCRRKVAETIPILKLGRVDRLEVRCSHGRHDEQVALTSVTRRYGNLLPRRTSMRHGIRQRKTGVDDDLLFIHVPGH